MKKIIVENQEIINLIEAEGYEVSSRKDLLSHMISAGIVPSDSNFQAYHKEYQEHFVKYEALKAELEKAYVLPLAPDGRKLTWNLDFATRELAVQGIG